MRISDIVSAFRALGGEVVAKLKPASRENIEQVAGFCGQPLPKAYRGFLEWAGEAPNALWVSVPFDLRIATVLDYYRQTLEHWPDTLPEGYVVIGLDRMTNSQISLAVGAEGGDVRFTYDEEIGERLHDSLGGMLMHHLQRHRVARHPHMLELDIPPKHLAHRRHELRELAREKGLKVLNATDGTSWLASGGGVDIVSYQIEAVGGWLQLGGPSEEHLRWLARSLCDVLEARVRSPKS